MSTLVLDTITGKSTSTTVTIGSTPVVSASANSMTIRGEGSAQTSIQQGLTKCWLLVAADGASILDSLNVSSHDDDGTGDGGVHINNDMGSVNYVVQLTADDGGAGSSVNAIEVTNGTVAAGAFDYETNYVNAGENRVAFNVIRHIAVLGDLA
jgi:hypothetical protein